MVYEAYNLTDIASNATTISFMQRVNETLMFGWLGTMFLMVITAICFIAFIQTTNNPKRAMGASLFIGFILSILLRALSLIPNSVLFLFALGAAGAAAFMTKD